MSTTHESKEKNIELHELDLVLRRDQREPEAQPKNPALFRKFQEKYSDHQIWRIDDRLEALLKWLHQAHVPLKDLSFYHHHNQQQTVKYLRKICNLSLEDFVSRIADPFEFVENLNVSLSERQKRILNRYVRISKKIVAWSEGEQPVAAKKSPSKATIPIQRFQPLFTKKMGFALGGIVLVGVLVLLIPAYHDARLDQNLSQNSVPSSSTLLDQKNDEPVVRNMQRPISPERSALTPSSKAMSDHVPPRSNTSESLLLDDKPKSEENSSTQQSQKVLLAHATQLKPESRLVDPLQQPDVTAHIAPPYNIIRGDPKSKKISFTFDGHCESQDTDIILGILDRFNIKCTFFLTGEFIEQFPKAVLKILAAGHEVGNHTYSHPHMGQLTEAEFVAELKKAESAFYNLTGKHMAPYWRAPYGEYSPKHGRLAKKIGFLHVHWTHWRTREHSLDTVDWVDDPESEIFFSSEEIAQHILTSRYKSGGIVLLHVGARQIDPIYRKLPDIITGLKEQGYQFITVSDIVSDISRAKS